MSLNRRSLFEQLFAAGAVSSALATPGLAAALEQEASSESSTGEGADHDSAAFWSDFVPLPGKTRSARDRAASVSDADTRVDFLHFGNEGLRYAYKIEDEELLDYPGDVTVSLNVGGIRLSKEDREKFVRLQSAQLRIDVLQSKPLLDVLDPMAWTALSALLPDKSGNMPPLRDLSFDPATVWSTSTKAQKIVLPGGSGLWAVNVSMVKKDSDFLKFVKGITKEVGRFAPLLGLPAISLTALNAFCVVYGAIEKRTTFLLNSKPSQAYVTREARKKATSKLGINMLAGDYILVPQKHSSAMAPYFDRLEFKQGYLIEKKASGTKSLFDQAESAPPDVSYISVNVKIEPLIQQGPGDSAAPAGAAKTSSAKPAAGKPVASKSVPAAPNPGSTPKKSKQ